MTDLYSHFSFLDLTEVQIWWHADVCFPTSQTVAQIHAWILVISNALFLRSSLLQIWINVVEKLEENLNPCLNG